MDKLIVVPRTSEAMERLDYDQAADSELIQIKLEYEDYISLYQNGFWNGLSEAMECNIDDHEDEQVVDGGKLANGVRFCRGLDQKESDPIKKISKILEDAQKLRTGIYFYF